MNPLGWGRRITVHAVTMRVVAYHDAEHDRFKIPQAKDLPWFEPTAVDAWPGEPVPLEWDPPKGGPAGPFRVEPSINGAAIVRWRRLKLDMPHDGIVVGSCWRHEGVLLDSTGMTGPKRTINLYEVSLVPPLRGTRALIVFVHPQDIQLVEEPARGVPAPTRVGVGGRLGGGR